MKRIINVLILFLPWCIRRRLLNTFWGYQIHPQAKIGFSYIYPKHLIMEKGARIGHLNIAIHLNSIKMGFKSIINRENWITGFPTHTNSPFFAHQLERESELIIGKESIITKKHHLDCTSSIKIGNYVTIAGYSSQFLTHSIDVYQNRQDSHPISIGDYCFVSTAVRVLGGSNLPAYSVLAAGSVLNKNFAKEWQLYAGIPAKAIKEISKDAKYFNREQGIVY